MSEANPRRLYVGNLHPSVSEGDLIKIFSDVGHVIKVDYLWHFHGPLKGQPKGFAFIEFFTEEEYDKGHIR